ncbi:hypothetical protein GALL_528510 [mine drainage metagenome]|uniref:Uncharacterized protein n=1 Tax=mine drainage metagenome TaxID=410659 RepID=A0A1J5P359_9ZZZZ
MRGGRGDDVAAVATHIDALRQSGTIPYEAAGVGKIKVPAAATGRCLHGYGKGRYLTFQAADRSVATMVGVDVEDHEVGNLASHDADIRVGPSPIPLGDSGG